MENLIIENLSKNYKKKNVLENINLTISSGMFGLLGPNGAGKTTLIQIMASLIQPSEGVIHQGDLSWNNTMQVKKNIGYLPQYFSIYKQVSIREALEHICILKGYKKNSTEIVTTMLEKVNLLEHENKKIAHLSGGMLRRVGIAQALIGNPKIILVDEPTAGLDPEERIRFRNLLRKIGRESIVIISTHIVEDVESICNQIAILKKGTIIINGDIKKINQSAVGKVWGKKVSQNELYSLSEDLNVISSRFIDNSYYVKVISDNAPLGFEPVIPSLEDAYLYLMEKKNE